MRTVLALLQLVSVAALVVAWLRLGPNAAPTPALGALMCLLGFVGDALSPRSWYRWAGLVSMGFGIVVFLLWLNRTLMH
jgi:membrane-bound ClpP family serine protease